MSSQKPAMLDGRLLEHMYASLRTPPSGVHPCGPSGRFLRRWTLQCRTRLEKLQRRYACLLP
eukprot:5869602-Pleurochrysis_carterae.AAC.1